MKYRKKPVVINAWPWNSVAPVEMYPDWLKAALGDKKVEVVIDDDEAYLLIHTLEGDHFALPGDYIIQGVAGELYPCKPEIFARTYEPVE